MGRKTEAAGTTGHRGWEATFTSTTMKRAIVAAGTEVTVSGIAGTFVLGRTKQTARTDRSAYVASMDFPRKSGGLF